MSRSEKWWEVPHQATDALRIDVRVRLLGEFGPLIDIQYVAACMECKETWHQKWFPIPIEDIYHDPATKKEFHRSSEQEIWTDSDPDVHALWVRCLLHLETHEGVLSNLGLSVDPSTPIHDTAHVIVKGALSLNTNC